ncbi:VirB3 family type IV secretion system protein [Snodgrassella sp. CFCC 13594]|uniref:VirB3 family type IV secretion system protein n=1 Tax=Snodgrassella sp. CFCC 13594 TaxID=1775559 RepID=UPI0008366FEA|nr:VirB3 family type IV secretion system protein [Snodgrassella sp. CFCC 13594]
MANRTEDINTEQPTFGGLARQAMVLGVPLPALAICGFVGLMAVLGTMPFLQGKALFFLLLPVPVVAFLRTICANDDQALKIIMAETQWFLRRRNAKLFNGTTTILATKYGRQLSDYQRFFDEGTKGSAGQFRLSAESLPTRQ